MVELTLLGEVTLRVDGRPVDLHRFRALWTGSRSVSALGEVEQARAVWLEALELYQRQERDLDADRVRRQLADLGVFPEIRACATNGGAVD
ncbi:hypothetical protein GCM10010492_50900 [Saccharothrix mutabilis subsp. mutabilis]|uniref:Uncharacterized protein n=1 Tax=Saccharothrix mutabilis subsp. mutabilis TaxID=66855 RepID=A0ABN0UBS8_9PSEU